MAGGLVDAGHVGFLASLRVDLVLLAQVRGEWDAIDLAVVVLQLNFLRGDGVVAGARERSNDPGALS